MRGTAKHTILLLLGVSLLRLCGLSWINIAVLLAKSAPFQSHDLIWHADCPSVDRKNVANLPASSGEVLLLKFRVCPLSAAKHFAAGCFGVRFYGLGEFRRSRSATAQTT